MHAAHTQAIHITEYPLERLLVEHIQEAQPTCADRNGCRKERRVVGKYEPATQFKGKKTLQRHVHVFSLVICS